jgi:hypothetical protein
MKAAFFMECPPLMEIPLLGRTGSEFLREKGMDMEFTWFQGRIQGKIKRWRPLEGSLHLFQFPFKNELHRRKQRGTFGPSGQHPNRATEGTATG